MTALLDLARDVFGGQEETVRLPQSTSTVYATAVSDSSDGMVKVVMDGLSITQPSGEEETETILASDFHDGQAELRLPAYAGTVSIIDSNDNQLLEDEFQVDGRTLTIEALQVSKQVEVSYPSDISVTFDSSDFDDDSIALQYEPNGSVTVTQDGETVESTYSDGVLTVTGASIASDAAFTVSYSRDVSIVVEFDDGICLLPDAPEAIVLKGITLSDSSDPVETEISDYVLDGSIVTLEDTTEYDQYTVSYSVPVQMEFNWSDTLPDEPIDEATELDDDEDEPVVPDEAGIVQLEGQPETVIVTKDGETYSDYTLEGGTLTLAWTPDESVQYIVEYSSDIFLDLSTSDFSNGEYQLPSAPSGTVEAIVDGTSVECSVEGYLLTIPSLVSDVASYTVTYQAEIENGEIEIPTSPSIREGEVVQVSVINGTPVATAVVGEGDRQDFNIDLAYSAAATAEELADEAKTVAEATGQHFWNRSTDPDGDGAGTGAFVTDVERDDFLEHINDQTETRPLHNLLMNAEGILLRAAKKIRAAFTPSGVAFYDGAGNDSSNIVSSFTNSSVNLGRSNEKHLSITPSAIYMYDADGTVHSSIGTDFTIGRTSSYNTLLTSSAVYIRNAAKYLLRAAGSTVYFYDGSGNNTANIAAQIGSAGATIGKTASAHVDIDSDSIDFYDGTQGILSMVNDANYSGFTWTPTTLAGGDSGGRILSAKNEPYMWIQPYTGLSIGGTQPSRGAVRISDNGVTIVPSLTLNNALTIDNGGTGATTAAAAWTALGGGTIGKKNSLAASDIPNHSTSKLTSGTLGISRGGTGSSAVKSVVNTSTVTIYVWGPVVMVQIHGVSKAPDGTAIWSTAYLSSYKPGYNISTIVAATTGELARAWVSASDGKVYLSAVNTASLKAWYGTLTYIYVPA